VECCPLQSSMSGHPAVALTITLNISKPENWVDIVYDIMTAQHGRSLNFLHGDYLERVERARAQGQWGPGVEVRVEAPEAESLSKINRQNNYMN